MPPTEASKRSDHPCERVLVVDDNADMLTSMRDILELSGATVRTTASGEQALEILREGFVPSVVLIDLRLGTGERGDQFARRLRSDPSYAKIPIVIMSGDIHELRRLEHTDNADATLGKPFDIDHLHEALSELCAEESRT